MTTIWRRPTKYIVAIGLVAFGLWVVYLSRPVIPLLVFASLVALMLSPGMRYLQTRLRMPLWLAIAIVYVLFLAVVAVLLWSLLTSLGQTVRVFDEASVSVSLNGLATVSQRVRASALPLPGLNVALSNGIDGVLAAIRGVIGGGATAATPPEISASLGQALLHTFSIGINGLGTVLSALTSLTLIVLLAVYLSFSHEWLYSSLMDKVPPSYRPEIAGVLNGIKSIWAGYLRGKSFCS